MRDLDFVFQSHELGVDGVLGQLGMRRDGH